MPVGSKSTPRVASQWQWPLNHLETPSMRDASLLLLCNAHMQVCCIVKGTRSPEVVVM